jgi:alanyl-tRNA synthetase
MKTMTANETRKTFLRFFESKGHRPVRNSSMLQHRDYTLLLQKAGK